MEQETNSTAAQLIVVCVAMDAAQAAEEAQEQPERREVLM